MQPQSYLHPALMVSTSRGKGRGVFTSEDLPQNLLIEVAPVIVMSGNDRSLLDQTLLHDYIFEWGERKKQCAMALGLIPIYNHSYASNCIYEMHFKEQLIVVKTIIAIRKNKELFINYNGEWNDKTPLWFDAK
jgi:SET domain-containing protein